MNVAMPDASPGVGHGLGHVTAESGTRIAYVIGELTKGGAEYQLYELVRGLDRRRFVPAVFVLSEGGYWTERLRELGVEVHEQPYGGSVDVGRLRSLRRRLAAFRPHVMHTVMWPGNTYGRLAAMGLGIPVVVTAERNVIRRPAWQRGVERVLDRMTDRYLVNSQSIVDELVGHGGLAQAKMQVIHNGIDLTQVPPFEADRERARATLGFAPGRRLVAQVGRLEPQKDYPTYLAAAARVAERLPDVDFLIVGEGTLRPSLEAEAARLGVGGRVQFTGVRHDVPALLGAVDVFVLTSLYEGLPNVVIEAMSSGAVVVTTDVGGARELVVPGETGVVVPVGRPDVVAAEIERLLADPSAARRMALAARARIQDRFTVEAMVRRTTAVYDELLAAAGVAAATSRAA
jgi:glycosyltransferase involved in cell wall biosynthesis